MNTLIEILCTFCATILSVWFFYLKMDEILDNKDDDSNNSVVENPEDIYKNRAKQRFLASFSSGGNDVSGSVVNYNENIDPIFYSKDEYQKTVDDPANLLEKTWKRRILMESTPRGNVIMFYDAFKRAFSYYSDQNMPYVMLNAICMKYVLMYRCRDFFLDETVLPEGVMSPLFKIHEEIVPSSTGTNEKKNDTNKISVPVSKGPFAKLKNYSLQDNNSSGTKESKGSPVVTGPIKNIAMNRIIHIGRVVNFSILDKYAKKFPNPKVPTVEYKIPSEGSAFSYKDFKSWRSPPVNMFE